MQLLINAHFLCRFHFDFFFFRILPAGIINSCGPLISDAFYALFLSTYPLYQPSFHPLSTPHLILMHIPSNLQCNISALINSPALAKRKTLQFNHSLFAFPYQPSIVWNPLHLQSPMLILMLNADVGTQFSHLLFHASPS